MFKILSLSFLTVFFINTISPSYAQKGNYELVAEFPPPHIDFSRNKHDRRYQLNDLKLSESGKLLLAEYGNRNSLVAIYSLDSMQCIGAYWIDNIVELEECYFSDDDTKLYVRVNRYASDYKVIIVGQKSIRDISCDKTPKGCNIAKPTQETVQFYSPDHKYYFARNANDKRTLHIYKRAGD
ncbi:MAG TPA: hypothetical protein PLY32_00020 [Salinivirgaceae bacterium]|nr:hypothetical protein [Salinivirgaceae bacterium]HQA75480.1 hypothetical protein [Salinivirgaceae bacterium]